MSVDSATDSNTGVVAMPDGTELFTRSWPIEDSAASIAIVHGYGEHSGRYDHVAARFNSEGYSVYSYDQRAHGKSPGTMGYIPSFQTHVDDCAGFIEHIVETIGGMPEFVFGHSMGALVSALYVEQHQPALSGLILSSGAFKVADDVAPLMQRLSAALSVVLPKLPVHQVDPAGLSHKAEVVSAYESDPLVYHGKIQARTGYQMMTSIAAAQEHASDIQVPVLLLHGTEDSIADPDGSRIMHERIGAADKTLKRYDGGYHEVFNDDAEQPFLDDVVAWLAEHR